MVLQAIVAYEDVGGRVSRQQGAGGGDALACHKHGDTTGAGHQQGFIAHVLWQRLGRGLTAVVGAAAIAARDDAGRKATGLQVCHGGQRDRCFPGAACNHIANDDDRHAWMLCLFPTPLVQFALKA